MDAVGDEVPHVIDADGRRVPATPTATRIVSLVPSAALTLGAMGAAELVVARTDYDTAAWTRSLPSVGGGLNPSLEAVAAARPDLVIRFGGPQDTRTPAALDALGIRHVAIRPDGIADVLETAEILGTLTGRRAAAAALSGRIAAGLDSVRDMTSGLERPRAAYVLGGSPPWVAGPGSYVQELMEAAGAENAFADLGSLYAAVSVEEFVARRIDVLLTPDPGRLDPRVAQAARVVEVGDALELPGPDVVAAARLLARLLHGGKGR